MNYEFLLIVFPGVGINYYKLCGPEVDEKGVEWKKVWRLKCWREFAISSGQSIMICC